MNYSKKYLEAIRFAAYRHALNFYGDAPYYEHFKDVEQVLKDHGYDDEQSLIMANLHDIIEDGGVTYNDVRQKFGIEVAEVVYLCSDNKGRNRKARKNEAFYDELKRNACAIRIKIADRIANLRKSIATGHSMKDKYKQEYAHFKKELFFEGHINSMWDELDYLVEYGKLYRKL